jgi:hypothetical protein
MGRLNFKCSYKIRELGRLPDPTHPQVGIEGGGGGGISLTPPTHPPSLGGDRDTSLPTPSHKAGVLVGQSL